MDLSQYLRDARCEMLALIEKSASNPLHRGTIDQLDQAFWLYCEAEQEQADRFDYTNKIDR